MSENVAVVPGTDGSKMSKSYQNTIDIFAGEKLRKKQISSIVTDSTPLEEPKNWQDCNIFKIAKLFLSKEKQEELKGRYERGGEGYGHFKAYLNELVETYFKEAQENYENYLKEPKKLEEILEFGASKARKIAQNKMQKIYDKIGL